MGVYTLNLSTTYNNVKLFNVPEHILFS